MLPNNPHARRPPKDYLLGVQGYLRRVMGNVNVAPAILILKRLCVVSAI
ncbi:MAG: hypothetical protein IM467_13855 [Microcystis sp. M137S2]|jgi:hypothetical protein|nr:MULTISPECIES: hypothetical protein [unclassified Microcystis]MCA2671166.1 hypothetical protein [Microcystis sp. M080S2]MCA2762438.1 hypothetical protein [Microcystis sp. M151S2]MCA2642640.1 hypothetical protein [Microcystis sp. M087S2]MCA2740084.1 hypothetical protein [Microcystis sp. M165S2]MCA2755458.1 hypothetical protein [Microcystis sp. M137S2]